MRCGAAEHEEGEWVDEAQRGDGDDAGREDAPCDGTGRGGHLAGDVAYGGEGAAREGDGAAAGGGEAASGRDEAAFAGGVGASGGHAGTVGAGAAPDVLGIVTAREAAGGADGDEARDRGEAGASAARGGGGSFTAPASWPAPLPGTRSPDVAPPSFAPALSDGVATSPVRGPASFGRARDTVPGRGADAVPGRGGDAVPGIPTSPEGPGWAAFGYPLARVAPEGMPRAGYATSPYVATSPVPASNVAAPATAAGPASYGAPVTAPVPPSTAPFAPGVTSPRGAPSVPSASRVAASAAFPKPAGPARVALSLGVVALLAYGLAFALDAGGAVACWFLGLVTGVLAVVFGAVGAGRARRAGGPGRGMSVAGLVCGVVGLVGGLAVLVVGFVLAVEEEDTGGGATHEYHAQASSGAASGPHAASR
ncbi:hypothetical protein STTU_1643 [Streptomyces sp. Tu6071]|nr:hypothetical protein STTU_1643 [Streptomyces sp. Tu6071]